MAIQKGFYFYYLNWNLSDEIDSRLHSVIH